MREFILATTDMVVQADSGIASRYFANEKWDNAFYGIYAGPIKLFANGCQEDLRLAYYSGRRPAGSQRRKACGVGVGVASGSPSCTRLRRRCR